MIGALRRTRASCAATLALALAGWLAAGGAGAAAEPEHAGAGAGQPLRVCLLAHAPPLSDQGAGAGFDVDVMSAVATRLGVAFTPVWIENEALITEVETGDLPLAPLARGRCDATPSVPGEAALRGASGSLRLTQPYYGAAFELVGADAADLGGLRGRTVAVQMQTVAHFALQGAGVTWTSRTTPAEAIEAVDAKAADAALVWGPALGPLGRAPAPAWQPPQGLRWNQHVALRRDDAARADAIEAALAALLREGEITRLARAHGMPSHAPFASTSNPGALAALGIGVRGRP